MSGVHHRSVGASLEWNKENLTLTLTLTLDSLLPSTVFHNKIYAFFMIFTALWFLRLIQGLDYRFKTIISLHQCTSYVAPLANLPLRRIYLCKWIALCLSGNFQASKDKLALWVALLQITIHNPTIDDTTIPDSCINYISFFASYKPTVGVAVQYTSHLKVKKISPNSSEFKLGLIPFL